MKKLFVVTAFVLLVSCVGEDPEKLRDSNDREHDGTLFGSTNYGINEKTIDSCQYIIVSGIEAQAIVHKPNCRNIFHSNVR